MRLGRLMALVALAAGCSRIMGTSGEHAAQPIPAYADGPAGLSALFGDVLEAARKDDRDRVHDLLASTLLSDEELVRLLGPAAAPLIERYHAMMAAMINRGAVELVAQVYERKFDTVEVLPIDPAATDARDEDRAAARALVVPQPIYSVRIKKAGESRGLRYDFWIYLRSDGGGRWKTGNLLGKALLERR
jgi:hypothetical protein